MWDFSFSRAVWSILRTVPFIVVRLLVYGGIALGYVVAAGAGAGLGFAIGHVSSGSGAHAGGAFWGGLIGFALATLLLYWAREYILYLVKAAHIAVLVQLYDNKPIPNGQGQVRYGAAFVKSHFVESSVLFGIEQLIKGVLRSIFGVFNTLTGMLPIPALQSLIRLVEAVVRMSLTYLDEIILAYLIRTNSANPWQTGQDGLILYAQNYRHILKNALWLSLFMWLTTAAIFAILVGPFAAFAALMPSHAAWWGLVFALIFAFALKRALVEPLCIAALMQVFFKTIEGQTPDPQWEQRLNSVSAKFREMTQEAAKWVPRPATLPSALPTAPAGAPS